MRFFPSATETPTGRVNRPAPRASIRPAGAAERVEAIDVVRGAALFGVLTVNLLMGFRVSLFAQFVPGNTPVGLDGWIERAVESAFELKAFALFSLLFGVGLAIQFERLQRTARPTWFLFRRMVALLGFGLLHLVFVWNGDILTEYAIAGLLVLAWMRAPQWMLAASSAVSLLLYAIAPLLSHIFVWPDPAQLTAAVETAQRFYPTCSLATCWHQNLRELPLVWPLHTFIFPRTFGLFLLGMWLWRSGAIGQMGQRRALLLTTAAACLALGSWLTHAANEGTFVGVTWLADLVAAMGPVVLAIGYAASLAWLALRNAGARWLMPLAHVGRTAFSNYIAQSLIFGTIFFGYGLGAFGRVSVASAFGLGVAVYSLQAGASTLWLSRYRFGPLEWLWRVLMYGKAQPIRNDA